MKAEHLTDTALAEVEGWWVLTADQVDSRHHRDAVPAALDALQARCGPAMRLPFERTVGDELQGVTRDASTLVDAVCELTRLGGWRIGVGLGRVELPLPAHTREARGQAFIAARDAIGRARRQATMIGLVAGAAHSGAPKDPHTDADPRRGERPGAQDAPGGVQPSSGGGSAGSVSGVPYRGVHTVAGLAERAESGLIVLRALLARRTPEGWRAMQLLDTGLSHREVAEALGITESAVSQRLSRAQRDEGSRAGSLCRDLLEDLCRASSEVATPDGRMVEGRR